MVPVWSAASDRLAQSPEGTRSGVGVESKNRLTIVASLRDVVGRSDDNETLFAGHNVVSVLLHSNLCKPMLYNGLLSLTPVP